MLQRMMKVLLLLTLITEVSTFTIVEPHRKITLSRMSENHWGLDATKNDHNSFGRAPSFGRFVDVKRAKDCADHIGECSEEELKELRDGLHRERLQNYMLSGMPLDASLEQVILEEELEAQLELMKDHEREVLSKSSSATSLFPEVEEPMRELPHLKDNTISSATLSMALRAQEVALEETLWDEEILESFVICFVLAALLVVPQLIH